MAEAQISVVEVVTGGVSVVEVTIPGPQGGGGSGSSISVDPLTLTEIATPASPASDKLYLFARDNGAGITQLCVKFANGNVLVIGQDT